MKKRWKPGIFTVASRLFIILTAKLYGFSVLNVKQESIVQDKKCTKRGRSYKAFWCIVVWFVYRFKNWNFKPNCTEDAQMTDPLQPAANKFASMMLHSRIFIRYHVKWHIKWTSKGAHNWFAFALNSMKSYDAVNDVHRSSKP